MAADAKGSTWHEGGAISHCNVSLHPEREPLLPRPRPRQRQYGKSRYVVLLLLCGGSLLITVCYYLPGFAAFLTAQYEKMVSFAQQLRFLLVSFFVISSSAQTFSPITPPSFPLAVKNPYLSGECEFPSTFGGSGWGCGWGFVKPPGHI